MCEYIPAANFILERVVNPAREIKGMKSSISKSEKFIKNAKKTGDLYHYLRHTIKAYPNGKTKTKLSENNLESFEDVISDFKIIFQAELSDYTDLNSCFEIGQRYNEYEIGLVLKNYSNQQGIANIYNDSNEVLGMRLKGEIAPADSIYKNKWIVKGKTVEYYLPRNKEDSLPNVDTPMHKRILNNEVPIHFFETDKFTDNGKKYIYRGQFRCEGFLNEKEKRSVRLALLEKGKSIEF